MQLSVNSLICYIIYISHAKHFFKENSTTFSIILDQDSTITDTYSG
jgi:hypothetical protein